MRKHFIKSETIGPSLRYRALLVLLLPVIFIITIRNALRRNGGWCFVFERFGFYRTQPLTSRPLWLHAASVGEVNAALPLIRLLRQQYPEDLLLVTTATATGARILQKQATGVMRAYLPLDYGYAVRRFLQRFKPRACLVMETELWPRLFAEIRRTRIPLLIINARLSIKTLTRGRWARRIYAACLENVDRIFARAELDRQGFIQLGASAEHIEVLGNIKFSAAADIQAPDYTRPFSRPYILAVSTHADEEWQLARLWQKLDTGEHILVIAPRHPERRHAILKQFNSLGLEIAVRSRNAVPSSSTRLYLADTLGELSGLMQHAEWVFMGGSLIPHGGQNLLEPAALGKAIVTGPFMHNFQQELAVLKAADAIVQVQDIHALAEVFMMLLRDHDRCQQLGEQALKTIAMHRDIALRYGQALKPFLDHAL